MKRILPIKERMPQHYKGEIEIIVKDRNGNTVYTHREPNIVKIFAKEMLAKRIAHTKIWDPTANSGSGAWVSSNIDPDDEFTVKYIVFGASFDEDGLPLDREDTRFYTKDPVTGFYIPITLTSGATHEGGLINPIPIAIPNRPLKRIEAFSFEESYQPSGTPIFQPDVRAINNILIAETVLPLDEYNGFGRAGSDYFTLTEVGLVGGKELDDVPNCECDPHDLFLEPSTPIACTANGGNVITISPAETRVDVIKNGDQVKVVSSGGSSELDQVSPFYLVMYKADSGRDIVLDRDVVDSDNSGIMGDVGVYRDTFRMFSHRILSVPVKKSSDFEIICRWYIIFN